MQLEILRAIQSFAHPALDLLFFILTQFGEAILLAAVSCGLYWCRDKALGRYLMVALCFSLCLNGAVKDLVQAARPIGEIGITSWDNVNSTGFSFPSAHTQSATVFWLSLAMCKRSCKAVAAAVVLVLGVGVSRMYLGVHWPIDVLGGIIFGVVITLFLYWLVQLHHRNTILLLLCGIAAVFAAIVGRSDDTYSSAVLVAGLLLGIWLEHSKVQFQTNSDVMRQLLRFIIGSGLLLTIYLVPKLILPHNVWSSCLRYGLISFTALGVYPYLFNRRRQKRA